MQTSLGNAPPPQDLMATGATPRPVLLLPRNQLVVYVNHGPDLAEAAAVAPCPSGLLAQHMRGCHLSAQWFQTCKGCGLGCALGLWKDKPQAFEHI